MFLHAYSTMLQEHRLIIIARIILFSSLFLFLKSSCQEVCRISFFNVCIRHLHSPSPIFVRYSLKSEIRLGRHKIVERARIRLRFLYQVGEKKCGYVYDYRYNYKTIKYSK